MSTVQLAEEIDSLPANLQEQVRDFVAFLKNKIQSQQPLPERQFGAGKGLVTMADDFDEPLEDFKEYI